MEPRAHALAFGKAAMIAIWMSFCFAPVVSTPGLADTGVAARALPSAQLVGKGRMTFLGFKVFDAELYAPQGSYSRSGPYALKLTYLRNFKGKAIADRSAEEIRKQGGTPPDKLSSWTRQMTAIFPDVSAGQSITGVRTSQGSTDFYQGKRKLGTIADPDFTRSFFDIWLGGQTRNPQLRAKLVGSGS
ncbi:chalcone isomerase family protein [uncultured Roseibium sp.]|uniref:chalcone isomerase family protein n=1 Tax=uncultured Roseibium sp. TaxID=1936171 RepID=UPI0026021755|nr:chalcone isomerase family protein [uncultured Roseibium sp.]